MARYEPNSWLPLPASRQAMLLRHAAIASALSYPASTDQDARAAPLSLKGKNLSPIVSSGLARASLDVGERSTESPHRPGTTRAMNTIDVCPFCEQSVDLLDDVADVDDGKVSVPAHIHCPHGA